MKNVTIIGNGPAGLTAAIYAARADLDPTVITGPQPGGQLTITTEVENFPGFPESISGPELIETRKKQAERFGADFLSGVVKSIDKIENGFKLNLDNESIESKTVILATGSTALNIGLPSELNLIGRGVSMCATCDAFFTRGKKVAVVGGGDTAIEEATFLTKFADSVTIIHRRDQFRASKAMQKKVDENAKLFPLMDSVIEEVEGDKKVSGLKIKNVKTGEIKSEPFDFLFVAIGHRPNSAFVKDLVNTDESGYVITDHPTTKTNIPGIFACGDLIDNSYRQAISAAGSGCKAALDAERYI